MATDVKRKKPVQRVQRRDGLPKAASVDAWLDAHRQRSAEPMLGGIAWYKDQLCIVARIKGKVHALPFSRFTQSSRFRDELSEKDRATYDAWWKQAMDGAFNAFVEKKRKEHAANAIGF